MIITYGSIAIYKEEMKILGICEYLNCMEEFESRATFHVGKDILFICIYSPL